MTVDDFSLNGSIKIGPFEKGDYFEISGLFDAKLLPTEMAKRVLLWDIAMSHIFEKGIDNKIEKDILQRLIKEVDIRLEESRNRGKPYGN